MKVGVFCDSFFPENKAVAVRLYHIVEAFSNYPHVKVVVHTSTKNSGATKLPIEVTRNLFNAPSNTGSDAKRLFSELMLGVEMFLRILSSRYHIVLFTSPPFFSSFLGVVAAKLRRIPYIFDVRDEYPEVYFTAGLLRKNSTPGKILTVIEKFIYANAFRVITVTEGIRQRIDEKINRKNYTLLVRNGFDRSLFKPQGEKEDIFTVVFHGNIGKFQDPGLIVSLAHKIASLGKEIRFKIIGFGNNDHALKTAKLDNLKFLGMVDYSNIPSEISRAHLGISFRTSELISQNSFPVKLYEYIGVGLPVIITPISEAGYFFESNQIGYQFDPNQEDLIAAKIIELSENKDQMDEITNRIHLLRESFSRQEISTVFVSQILHSYKDHS
jgi:glycosyltransferase involved in cell wall biosynthesis